MNGVPFIVAALAVLFPYALSMKPNGSLRLQVARFAEAKSKDLKRVVRKLDNSQIKLEPNKPFVLHKRDNPLSRSVTSQHIWSKTFKNPGTHLLLLDKLKKIYSTSWDWSRQHNMDYVLNVSQPVYIEVPADSLFRVESLAKDFWEFNTPLPWDEADTTCRAAGLKLAQPKTRNEVKELQKKLYMRKHNRESGCSDETWHYEKGYCFFFETNFMNRKQAATYCKQKKSALTYPAFDDITAWQKAVVNYFKANVTGGRKYTHAGAHQEPDGQWLWENGLNIEEEAWSPENPEGEGDCSALNHETGKIEDKSCITTWPTLCQGYSSNHWLGALGSNDIKCVEWSNSGKCIEEEDQDPESTITELWREGQPFDIISSDYALLLQIEHEKPLTLMKTAERRPFLCESACPFGFVNLGPRCLLKQKVWLTWKEAQAACVKIGLQLYMKKSETIPFTGTYWIGGNERSFAGNGVDMNVIKKLPYICELTDGTRKINVTNQLSYSDEKKFMLPKVVTKSNECKVSVKERTISETYPFSVQIDITGWIWVQYSFPTDEHGSNHCDNNNDWVSGEWCFAHSKWGYSTSYLHDGDQIMSQGDNARMTLNGTVTYVYNEHEVSTCDSDRARRSVRERELRGRSKRSIVSEKISKNFKEKQDDDNNKPLMSQLGKRAGEWVRALAQEKKAHLVAYTIDQLSPTVTDLKLEKEFSGISTPGSIFEEEFENTGSEHVITTFSKMKSVANTYRWSVSKGLSIEDSHITSYSMTNSQSVSNTFSLSNNVAQTEGKRQSINERSTDTISTSEGISENKSIGSSNTETHSNSQSFSTGEAASQSISHTESEGSTAGSSNSNIEGSTTGGSQSSSDSNSNSHSITDTSSHSQETSLSETESNQNTVADSNSQSTSQGTSASISHSQTDSHSSSTSNTASESHTETSEVSASLETSAKAGFLGVSVSVKASLSTSSSSSEESTRTSESSKTTSSDNTNSSEQSVQSDNTNTQEQSTTNETGHSSEQSDTSKITISADVNVAEEKTNSTEESTHHDSSSTNENTNTTETSASTENVETFDNNIHSEINNGTDTESRQVSSIDTELSVMYDNTHGQEVSTGLEQSVNQESTYKYEESHGRDVSRDLQYSQENQRTHTHQLNLDRNEEIETSVEEKLETTNEVTIPPNTRVKIEWRIEQKKVRLPWKATVHMTGWINVRFKNDDTVCDKYDKYRKSSWTYKYTSTCLKDNRLYGYPLSYLKNKNYIQQGDGLRFVANGVFEATTVTSHFLRVTETNLTDEDSYKRRKRDLRKLPSKVTDYHLEFDEHGNGRANIGNNNQYFRRFHAKKKYEEI